MTTLSAPHASGVGLQNCRVLVVEDERVIREILVRLIKAAGVSEIVDVGDAEEAWTLLASGKQHFHLLITDLVLPQMSGETLITKVRALANPSARTIPIIVLSANNTVEKYKQLERHAISSYLVKPTSPGDLKSAIESALAGRIANAPLRQPSLIGVP